MTHKNSEALFEKAKKMIPGGVNSPVRAFKSVGGNPVFMKAAKGAYLYDEDGNQYIDLINSWGPMILGHAHPLIEKAIADAIQHSFSFGAPTVREVEMAEKIVSIVPSVEKVRMVNSGTEATMSAIRVARGYTKRDKIIKFEGCYHGHGDSFLIAAGSGAITLGVPDSPGVTKGVANDTLTAPYNDLAAVEILVEANKGQVAAIILEPVVGNMGCVIPERGFLEGLRKLCDQHQIVLIFDEVMTGFRLALGGAQEYFGITPDMTTMGKIIGGGLPVGAYGGRSDIMDCVAPAGPVYQAGTLSGNPIAMAAGLTMLNYLSDNPSVYSTIANTAQAIQGGFLDKMVLLADKGINFLNQTTMASCGSMFTLFFTQKNERITNFEQAKKCNTALYGKYFHAMLERGVYLPPSQYESWFFSTAIDQKEIDHILQAHEESLTLIANEL